MTFQSGHVVCCIHHSGESAKSISMTGPSYKTVLRKVNRPLVASFLFFKQNQQKMPLRDEQMYAFRDVAMSSGKLGFLTKLIIIEV